MGKKKKKGEQARGVCVYCGNEDLITRDHVFPQSVFLVLDEQMITVPACGNCQHIKGLGDHDLRPFVVLDIGGSTHPDAFELVSKMLDESNVRLRNWIKKSIENATQVDLVTDTGVIVGGGIEFPFNTDRIMHAQEMAIRGLYSHEKGMVLPQDCPVEVEHIPWQAAPQFVKNLTERVPVLPQVKGNLAAWWASLPTDTTHDTPPCESSTWLIVYNNWVTFFGATGEAARALKAARTAYRNEHAENPQPQDGHRRQVIVPRDPDGNPIFPQQAPD